MPAAQIQLLQSMLLEHFFAFLQAVQSGPPQSTSVSRKSTRLLRHDESWHVDPPTEPFAAVA